jgi:N6-adenosine-specific RNA methylase IME4
MSAANGRNLDALVGLPSGPFRCIVADPPWQYGKWGRATPAHRPNGHEYAMPYPTMTVQEIAALPVAGCADKDCDLFLWTTQKYLFDAYCVMQEQFYSTDFGSVLCWKSNSFDGV